MEQEEVLKQVESKLEKAAENGRNEGYEQASKEFGEKVETLQKDFEQYKAESKKRFGISGFGEEKEAKPMDVVSKMIQAVVEGGGAGDALKNLRKEHEKNGSAITEMAIKAIDDNSLASGGVLITPDVYADILPYFTSASPIMNMNPTILNTDKGAINVNRVTSNPTASTVANRNTNVDPTTMTFDKAQLSEKVLKAKVIIDNDMFGQTAIQNVVVNALRARIAEKFDTLVLHGSGTNSEPNGIYNQIHADNKLTTAGNTLANMAADFNDAVQAVEDANITVQNGGWLHNSRIKRAILKTLSGNGTLNAYAEEIARAGTLLGYGLGQTNIIPNTYSSTNTRLYFGDFTHLYIMLSGGLRLDIDNSGSYEDSTGTKSLKDRNETAIRAEMRFDSLLAYDKAFSVVEGINY